LQIGLFQECCMSVMILNVVFQMLLDIDYHGHSQSAREKED